MALYEAGHYLQSAEAFSYAFESLGWKGAMDDRYNAACAWAQAGNNDSAFFQLDKIATKLNYSGLYQMITDPALVSLHNDSRWPDVCALVKQNKDNLEVNWNKPIAATLDTIFQNDHQYRMAINTVQQKYGPQSDEMKKLWVIISYYDSIDVVKVTAILDQYGWPGPDIVGHQNSENPLDGHTKCRYKDTG